MLTINSAALLALLFASAYGLDPIDLGTAGDYAILTKTGVTTTGITAITGNMGTSPIAETAMTGFTLVRSTDNTYSESSLVTGKVTSATHTSPTPSILTTAIGDMQNAYTIAAGDHLDSGGNLISPILNIHAGGLTDQTLVPGVYKWTNTVDFSNKLTFDGTATDVWILNIAQDLVVSSGAEVILAGGAKAENIFWQVSQAVTVGSDATINGIFLVKMDMAFNAGSTLNGAALAQTAVTLISTTVNAVSTTDMKSNKASDATGLSTMFWDRFFPTMSLSLITMFLLA